MRRFIRGTLWFGPENREISIGILVGEGLGRASAVGSVIGLVWALVDGFIGGLIFAWLYNRLAGTPSAS